MLKLRGVVEAGVQDEDDNGETPVVRAAADGLAAEDLRFLLDAGALLNQPTTNGLIPLWQAATFGQVEAAKLLIDNKAEVDASADEVSGGISLSPASNMPSCFLCTFFFKQALKHAGARASRHSV